jgi:4-aminobutyrate aminotransferase
MGQWVPGAHASTFGGNPIAAAAANATIDVIQHEGLLKNAHDRGEQALARLHKFQQDHPVVVRVEGRGLMIGIEFADAEGHALADFRDEVVNQCYLNGLLTLGAGASVLRIAAPLMISEEHMERGLDILERAIAHTEESML